MSFSFFLEVEEADLEDGFVVFDLTEALELGRSFCAVGFVIALVLCSIVEGAIFCDEKTKIQIKPDN